MRVKDTSPLTRRRRLIGVLLLLGLVAISVLWFLTSRGNVVVLEPAGPIAAEQRQLIIFATVLSLTVILPVFVMTAYITWRYRASNRRAPYKPDWDRNPIIESVWWIIPIIIITILAVITWNSSHKLDPAQPIVSKAETLEVQVVAMNWKWLFIYPEQSVASINKLVIPVNTPVHFRLTSDAPMNSFWIPELGGQIYAMPGMSTQLNLMADRTGSFRGSSANLSGEGFSRMSFVTNSLSATDFERWVTATKQNPLALNNRTYAVLAKQSSGDSGSYGKVESGFYQAIVDSYMNGHGRSRMDQE